MRRFPTKVTKRDIRNALIYEPVSIDEMHPNARPVPLGSVYAFLTVIDYARFHYSGLTSIGYVCKCVCGKVCLRTKQNLSKQFSCGCKQKTLLGDAQRTHGLTQTPTWRSWMSMRHRCSNPRMNAWKHYGARGIKVCDRWQNSFEAFLADMGERPAGKTLDRINNDGNYEPSNCRWATISEQAKNQRPRKRNALGQFGGLA